MVSGEDPALTPILIERRFPLDLAHSITSIRDLYDTSKRERWDPGADIDWGAFDPSAYDERSLAAARLSWSRRTWVEYTGLPETPALLIRFCLEVGREADPKYYLSVRNTEEAWHVEACHRFAECLGGYIDEPLVSAYAEIFNQSFHRQALDADRSLDGYVAARCALADGLDLELWRGYQANATDAVAERILSLCVADKQRHAAFGWHYLESRAAAWTEDDIAAISEAVAIYFETVERRGFHCAWLVPQGAAADVVEADRVTARAGLGALLPEDERDIVTRYLARTREKCASLGIPADRLLLPDDAVEEGA
jgi:hypothetical protein